MNSYIIPNWPAPKNIRAYTSTRLDGFSGSPYDSFNLSLATGDAKESVLKNRQKLYRDLDIKGEPFWLQQEHSNIILATTNNILPCPPTADASFTRKINDVCIVLTADCVPILLCDNQGTMVAAVHAGWKGIVQGIIENSIGALGVNPSQLLAWLGPAIGPHAFQVGPEMVDIFHQKFLNCRPAFRKVGASYFGDLYQLATHCLKMAGVQNIYGGEFCTFSQKDIFYSHRRDGKKSGRIASMIWLAP